MSAMRTPASAMAGLTSSRNTRTMCSMLGPTCLAIAPGSRSGSSCPTAGDHARLDLVAQAGHPDHEELVQVGGEDGQVLEPFQQGISSAAMARTRSLNCSQEILPMNR